MPLWSMMITRAKRASAVSERLPDTPAADRDDLQHQASAVFTRMGIDGANVIPPACN